MLNHRAGWLLAALLISPALLSAQQLTQAQKRERAIAAEMEVEAQELVTLEKETAHAMALNNSSFFQRVYSDDFFGTAPTGERRDRNALVAAIQNSNAKYTSFISTDIHVRIFGPTAVVTCTWSARGAQNGHDFSRQYRVIHVYLNNIVGGWKVVASQETILPGS
jgi:ketosteroid isomerase-like protein